MGAGFTSEHVPGVRVENIGGCGGLGDLSGVHFEGVANWDVVDLVRF